MIPESFYDDSFFLACKKSIQKLSWMRASMLIFICVTWLSKSFCVDSGVYWFFVACMQQLSLEAHMNESLLASFIPQAKKLSFPIKETIFRKRDLWMKQRSSYSWMSFNVEEAKNRLNYRSLLQKNRLNYRSLSFMNESFFASYLTCAYGFFCMHATNQHRSCHEWELLGLLCTSPFKLSWMRAPLLRTSRVHTAFFLCLLRMGWLWLAGSIKL